MSDDGMRIVRGKGKRPKVSTAPITLDQVPAGQLAMIMVRVGAHLAGPGRGAFDFALCRAFDYDTRTELFVCGDLNIKNTPSVRVYQLEDIREDLP